MPSSIALPASTTSSPRRSPRHQRGLRRLRPGDVLRRPAVRGLGARRARTGPATATTRRCGCRAIRRSRRSLQGGRRLGGSALGLCGSSLGPGSPTPSRSTRCSSSIPRCTTRPPPGSAPCRSRPVPRPPARPAPGRDRPPRRRPPRCSAPPSASRFSAGSVPGRSRDHGRVARWAVSQRTSSAAAAARATRATGPKGGAWKMVTAEMPTSVQTVHGRPDRRSATTAAPMTTTPCTEPIHGSRSATTRGTSVLATWREAQRQPGSIRLSSRRSMTRRGDCGADDDRSS